MSVDQIASDHITNPDELQAIVEDKGVLAHRGGTGAIEFQFTYLGFPFAVRAEAGTREATVNIHAVLGFLPYTSESRHGRYGVMKILEASSHALGQRVQLGDQQRLIMSDKRKTKDALTPVNLMTVMVGMLLEVKPYLQLLSDYLAPLAADEVAADSAEDQVSSVPEPIPLPAE